jgi:hypothetical protein
MENYQIKKFSGMKRHNSNMILKLGLLFSVLAIVGSSCVKSRPGATDFSNLSPTVLIPEGGLQNFGTSALLFPGTDSVDTANFHLNYAATSVAPVDEVISYAFDPAALAAYNATLDPKDTFAIFPDSIFTFKNGSGTVVKGQNYSDPVFMTVYPDKVNPKKNYMYPVSITAAPSGTQLTSNFNTIYYHFIGNPIAGAYTDNWLRWNTPAVPPAPPSQTAAVPALFAPIDGTTVSIPDNTGINYILTFDDDGSGNLTNFAVALDPASVTAAQITAGTPTLVKADPINGVYEFTFTYINGSGLSRVIQDTYTK